MSVTSRNRVAENEGTIPLLIRRQVELNALLEITQAINSNFPAATLFRMYEFILTQHLKIKNLVVMIQSEQQWNLAVCKTDNPYTSSVEAVESSVSHYYDIQRIDSTSDALQIFDYIIPVYHKTQPLAYVLIGGFENLVDGMESDMRFIQTLTNVIVVAIENKKLFKEQLEQERLKKELDFARQVQSMLVPGKLPVKHEYEANALYLPHSSIGGDYYDFIELSEEEVLFCIADVSGKGVSAALLMANFQANLRALANTGTSLPELIQTLNQRVLANTQGDKFITFFVAKYAIKTRTLEYVNSGHNPPVLINDGVALKLSNGSPMLGVLDELPYINNQTVSLSKGALLLCFTDGLIESVDGFENGIFSEKTLDQFLIDHRKQTTKEINDLIDEKLIAARQSVSDDITVLSCKFF